MILQSAKQTLMAALLLGAFTLTSCATPEDDDPLEAMNRGVYAFNEAVDKGIIRPIAWSYRYITPDPLRERIGNFSDNLREPVNMLNAFLQGDFEQGMVSFWRFTLNSTIGLAGLHDVAGSAGLHGRREDFGQTMAVWGSGSGAYIVLPILGPSNGRDALGRVVDWFTNPFNYVIDDSWGQIGLAAGQGLVERERLLDTMDDIYETSLDPYATFRSVYAQHRAAQIANRRGSLDKSYESPAEYEAK